MTEKDRAHYDTITAELLKKLRSSGLSLEQRLENLELLMFWSLVCDAGEQGIIPEQKELMDKLGWNKILDKALRRIP